MLRYVFITLVGLGLVSSWLERETAGAEQPKRILLIMADDIGIEGLSCYGGRSYRTPHLDQLAAGGLRFTRAYSQPLCTPTRVQIMTGKYNYRNWRSFGILDPQEKTFGHHLQEAGFTTGIFGKWQLQSYDPPDLPNAEQRRGTGMHPKDAGFHEYSLFHSLHTEDKGSRYANPSMLVGKQGQPGALKKFPGKYGEDVWVDQIVDFFDRHRDDSSFVYYPMALPHRPFEPTPGNADWDPANIPAEDVKFIKDMVEYMDTTVGNLLSKLKEKKLHDDTLVLFYADNGTHTKVRSLMADGRTIAGGKASSKQTAIHVPLIASWPGRISPSVSHEIVDASDFLPTLLHLVGKPEVEATDGISFAHRLFGKPGVDRKHSLIWYDPRPGWDKERFNRHIFALDKHYKLFRSGRLYRLTDKPLEEIPVDPLAMTPEDREAQERLQLVIDEHLENSSEPPLVDAYGNPQHDLLYIPKSKQELQKINRALLETGEEVSYGSGDIQEQKLWIFRPLDLQPDESRACIFFIHGGGWGGSPASLAPQAVYFQRRGYITASIHFRGPGENLTPQHSLRDARQAYRWLLEHAREYQIDPKRIVVSGGSAGGHLSMALSTIALPGDDVIEKQPAAMVLFNPALDLVRGATSANDRFKKWKIDRRSFSPSHHLKEGLPPTLILSGSEDHVIPPKLAHAFQTRMRKLKNRCDYVEYPGATHAFFNYGRHDNRYFQWTMWAFEDFLLDLGLTPR